MGKPFDWEGANRRDMERGGSYDDGERKMRAKYDGRCAVCKGKFRAGSFIIYTVNTGTVVCSRCMANEGV